MTTAVESNRTNLRRKLRAQRRALDAAAQQSNAHKIANHLSTLPPLQAAARVCAYLASDGEVSLMALLVELSRHGKKLALPVLSGNPAVMRFAAYRPGDALQVGRFNLLAPSAENALQLTSQDVVLLPLVGFDATGHRLGMGGGFYDRYFGATSVALRPTLIGVAHEIQRVPAIANETWDVDLDGIVTEDGFFSTRRR